MMKKIFMAVFAVIVLTIILATPSPAEQSIDFSGKWIVRWMDNDTRNPITLTQADGRLDGTYVNDSKDSCKVSGHLVKNNRVTLHIDCPKWDISMEGTASSDGNIIEGTYSAYGTSKGGFEMKRNPGRQ